MSVVEGPLNSGLVTRVKAILMKPTETWSVIDAEPATVKGLFTGYVMILAAIGPVANLFRALVFGYGAFGFSWRPSPLWAISGAIVGYLASLAGFFILALVIDGLAPSFGSQKDQLKAFKLAAYTGTAAWLAGIFGLVPWIGFLAIVGLYSLYLLYKGLPILMKTPADKALPYFLVVLVVAAIINIVAAAVVSPIMAMGRMGDYASRGPDGHLSGTMNIPGGGSVDLGRIQEAAAKMEAANKAIKEGKQVPVLSGAVLQSLLPGDVAGYTRGEISTESGGAGGYSTSSAEASYARGDASFKLSVVDSGAAGALGAMASAVDINHTERHGDSYETVGKVDGRMTTEKYDGDSKHGEYSVLADRVMISAEGDNVSIDDLKAAVSAVDPARVATLQP
jgi:hypothetical protein